MNDSTITSRIWKGFGVAGYLLGAIGRATRTVRLYNELQMMDDAELAERGLTRDDIGRHVAESIEPVTLSSMMASRPAVAAAVVAGSPANATVETAPAQRRAA